MAVSDIRPADDFGFAVFPIIVTETFRDLHSRSTMSQSRRVNDLLGILQYNSSRGLHERREKLPIIGMVWLLDYRTTQKRGLRIIHDLVLALGKKGL
jgi:hypothetical protein